MKNEQQETIIQNIGWRKNADNQMTFLFDITTSEAKYCFKIPAGNNIKQLVEIPQKQQIHTKIKYKNSCIDIWKRPQNKYRFAGVSTDGAMIDVIISDKEIQKLINELILSRE